MHVSLRAVTNLNAAMHPGSSVLLRLWLTMSSHLGLYELHCVHTVTELPKIHFFFFFWGILMFSGNLFPTWDYDGVVVIEFKMYNCI